MDIYTEEEGAELEVPSPLERPTTTGTLMSSTAALRLDPWECCHDTRLDGNRCIPHTQ